MRSRIERIIAESGSLRALPPVYQRIKEAVENPESSFEDIARIVENDTDLSTRLLRLANSSFYGYPSSVSAVPDALSVIGLQQFKHMALAVSMPGVFASGAPPFIDQTQFWKHSIAVGICARVMALELREANTERFFLAGLFNKIGRLVIYDLFPKDSVKAFKRAQAENTRLQTLELKILGFDSNEVGAAALKHWQLSSSLVELVRHSTKPVLAKNSVQDVGLVHIAAFIVESLRLGSVGERFVPEFSEAAWGYSGLEEDRLYYVVEELLRQYEEVSSVFLQET